MRFNEKLVLNSYMLSLFGVSSFEELSKSFKDDIRNEEVDEEGVSLFYYALSSRLFDDAKIDKVKLLEYDNNIVRHTKKLKQPIKWKYFQYITLLFVEIYLDMYFSSKESLLENLNVYLEAFNARLPKKERLEPFALKSLNRLAFWSATGSSKTLLMHMNYLQFGHYNTKKRYELTQEYGKFILFDYSYRYFKNDGFGKDYTILNLKDEPQEELKYNYLVGALLSFYQQKSCKKI